MMADSNSLDQLLGVRPWTELVRLPWITQVGQRGRQQAFAHARLIAGDAYHRRVLHAGPHDRGEYAANDIAIQAVIVAPEGVLDKLVCLVRILACGFFRQLGQPLLQVGIDIEIGKGGAVIAWGR